MKRSRQRDAILDNLMNRSDHPTAEMIYTDLKTELPSISMATVYRNLSQLTDAGQIQRLTPGDGLDHFDYICSPHSHFMCSCCGSISDINIDAPESLLTNAAENFDGIITGHSLLFFGKCPKCKSQS